MGELDFVRKMVVDCARAWREARCTSPGRCHDHCEAGHDYCDGDNHLESCPCELARQDLIAALNKLDMVDPRPA